MAKFLLCEKKEGFSLRGNSINVKLKHNIQEGPFDNISESDLSILVTHGIRIIEVTTEKEKPIVSEPIPKESVQSSKEENSEKEQNSAKDSKNKKNKKNKKNNRSP